MYWLLLYNSTPFQCTWMLSHSFLLPPILLIILHAPHGTLGIHVNVSVRENWAQIGLSLLGIQRAVKNQAPVRDTLFVAGTRRGKRRLNRTLRTTIFFKCQCFKCFSKRPPGVQGHGTDRKILTFGRDTLETKGHLEKRPNAAPWMAEKCPETKGTPLGNLTSPFKSIENVCFFQS